MTPPAVADLACPLRWSQLGLAKQCTFTAAARRQRRGRRPRTATAAATPPGRCWPRASRQSPPHREQGIGQLAALGKQLVECLPHAGAAAVLTVIMAREHPAGYQESQRPADVVADGLGLVVAIDEDQPEAGFPGDHTPRAQDAARRVDLVFAHGPSARAWAARIGLDDGRLRDGRSSVEGLSAAALPRLPSPRLTFAGRLRGDKAPDVLIEALALIDAPPPACLVGDGPLRAR
jgi:glycosyltransferase involved in cell wall biosynthesis